MPHGDVIEVYRDRMPRRGKWRWRLKAANGNIVADSGQGYADKAEARDMAHRIIVRGVYAGAPIHEV